MTYKPKTSAGQELERIKNLIAFNISEKKLKEKRKLNQHCVRYYFYDDSVLWIYPTSQKGWAYKLGVESIQEQLEINR